jgi:hypothetical protein
MGYKMTEIKGGLNHEEKNRYLSCVFTDSLPGADRMQ